MSAQPHNSIRTFRNANFTKRNSDCTNIVFAQCSGDPPEGDWIECDKTEIADKNCDSLFRQAGIQYFGYL